MYLKNYNFPKQAPQTANDPIGKAMEFKKESISGFQKAKEDSIKIQSSGRDAVLITTTFYPELAKDPEREAKIQAKIKEWDTWIFHNIYDVPFK